MADVIVVLNAGSSSLKFSVFVARRSGLEPDRRGNIEEIDTAPRFVAKDRAGHVLAEKSWGEGARLGHEGALDHLLAFLSGELADDRLVGVGHRVVHGGATYTRPLRNGLTHRDLRTRNEGANSRDSASASDRLGLQHAASRSKSFIARRTPKGPIDLGPFGFARFHGCGGWI